MARRSNASCLIIAGVALVLYLLALLAVVQLPEPGLAAPAPTLAQQNQQVPFFA
jgi:hypothetical protein